MISAIHHTGITVDNLERMVTFYREVGLEVVEEIDSVAPPEGNHTGIAGARRKLVFMALPGQTGFQIELVHYLDPPASRGGLDRHQIGSMHLCFLVQDMESEVERLSGLGACFLTEPKYSDVDGSRIGVVYGQDPEGNWIELIARS